MLVLSRKVGERVLIGDNILVIVRRVSKDRVSLAIEAPSDVPIMRTELRGYLYHRKDEKNSPAGYSPDVAETDEQSPIVGGKPR